MDCVRGCESDFQAEEALSDTDFSKVILNLRNIILLRHLIFSSGYLMWLISSAAWYLPHLQKKFG